MKIRYLLITLSLSLFTACGLFKKSPKKTITKERELPFLSQLENELIHLPSVQGKGQGKFEINQTRNRANLSFYFQKDQFLFVRATLFSIEGARALITIDSTIVLNRLEKTAMIVNTRKFLDSVGIPLSFQEIQGLLFGIPPLSWFPQVKQKEKFSFEGEIMPQVSVSFQLDPKHYHLTRMEINAKDKKAIITYQEYQSYQNTFAPQFIKVEFKGSPRGYVEIDKIHIKPLSDGFNVPTIQVPESYEVIRY